MLYDKKTCKNCGEEFTPKYKNQFGIQKFCSKKCNIIHYRKNNKEKLKLYNKRYGKKYRKKYYQENKKHIIEQGKEWRKNHSSYKKERYRRIYDDCDQGIIKETKVHLIFKFLNKCSSPSLEILRISFPLMKKKILSTYLNGWRNIGIEKYIKIN